MCLVYVNCCQGDAGGFLGVGMQLADFVPAVMTNRTVAMVSAAQAQALAFWENVLLKGIAPHKAVTRLYRGMEDLNLSAVDVRWMTPVLHCGYDTWRANPPEPPPPEPVEKPVVRVWHTDEVRVEVVKE